MRISNVKVMVKREKISRLRGYVDILVDDCIAVHEIRIIDGNRGLFVAMPSYEDSEGKHHDLVHPINQNGRDSLEKEILMRFYDEVYGLLGKINIDSKYELNFDVNNIFKISLRDKESMEAIKTYELPDYTDETLKKMEEIIADDLSRA